MQSKDDSLGRWWGSADAATLHEFSDGDALIELTWSDGAYVRQYETTHAEARDTLRRLGFAPSEVQP